MRINTYSLIYSLRLSLSDSTPQNQLHFWPRAPSAPEQML